jgi:GTP cyclohydrolase II
VPVALGCVGGRAAELVTFNGLVDGREHLACVCPPIRRVPTVRVHSECLTGDVLGSLRCDCGPQLDEALGLIARDGGILLYMRQEGRGIGLYNKLDTYLLQDAGADTFTANRLVGRQADERNYSAAAQMLHALGVLDVRLMTNNPEKLKALTRYGISVHSTVRTGLYLNPFNREYLRAKAEIAHHRLGFPARLNGASKDRAG